MIRLHQLGQVSLYAHDVFGAELFFRDVLGLRLLYKFGNLLFFDCDGVQIVIEATGHLALRQSSVLYFAVNDIDLAYTDLRQRGVLFEDEPHLVAPMDDHDLYMCFFQDPSGNRLALMHKAPKGYCPRLAR